MRQQSTASRIDVGSVPLPKDLIIAAVCRYAYHCQRAAISGADQAARLMRLGETPGLVFEREAIAGHQTDDRLPYSSGRTQQHFSSKMPESQGLHTC